ncbi:MAG: DMT family transporter [Coriobacteriia bacterium]|nr:DMT family transporter [Coriobacteriia bacterium]
MPHDVAATSGERVSGLIRVALTGIVWGTIPLVLRAADGDPWVKVFYRVFFATIVIGIWMLATGGWREVASLDRRKWWQVITQGLLLMVNWLLFLTALDLTEVATAELLGYTGPVFVAALTPLVVGERFDRRIVLPLGLALGGIVIILAQHGLALGGGRQALGAGLAAASALTYAALLLRSKKIIRDISSGALMLGEYGVASIVLLPLVIWSYTHGGAPTSAGAYAALATLGVVHTALTGFVFLSGLRRVRADHAGILMYAEPVSAVIFAALFLSEPLTAATLIGGTLVVLGGVLVARMEPMPGIEAPDAVLETGNA